MAEPPAKRARRVDSSTMWDMNDTRTRSPDPESDRVHRHSPPPRDDRRDGTREDRRYRSRSRDRKDRKRERSWSRDRRDRDRDGRGARDRKRSVSRERAYERRGYAPKGDRFRERSRSPVRNGAKSRSRSPPPRGYKSDRRGDRRDPRSREDGRHANGVASGPGRYKEEMDVDFNEDADEDEMEALMRKSMGFTRFRSTKNTKIPGNDIYGVRKEKKIEYRQYMNRIGGFNRPLSPSR
ncbi:U4/U6.U5 tri-snRNP-associated protein [Penicillium alfredii]|uniref:U4/U6.U5 tri-snRNP-associated protein n=1 Tax=Penicillium alfredii TaxID=1506179 RepID=A0A9W9F2Q9_9EURO|nr:U4/U6.U5 tri-snRNP-associated protein [Penicillium alfredii]KAJ5092395.1 U4/U6.U5 tri-snRNP-associated protein [Penicillium alfredii]